MHWMTLNLPWFNGKLYYVNFITHIKMKNKSIWMKACVHTTGADHCDQSHCFCCWNVTFSVSSLKCVILIPHLLVRSVGWPVQLNLTPLIYLSLKHLVSFPQTMKHNYAWFSSVFLDHKAQIDVTSAPRKASKVPPGCTGMTPSDDEVRVWRHAGTRHVFFGADNFQHNIWEWSECVWRE